MQIKINEKVLCIPPYISTRWSHIAALRMKGNQLSVTLKDGEAINIGGLTPEQISQIFSYHAAYLENEVCSSSLMDFPSHANFEKEGLSPLMDPNSINFTFGSIDGFNQMSRHNPAQINAPDLPLEVLHKISEISKVVMNMDDVQLPKAELGCNCFHCQIARTINPEFAVASQARDEEEVSQDELQFQQWLITQTGDQLYTVVNRLDTLEKYNVFLGEPVGCTCGKPGCEHILAVLKS